MSKFDFPSEFNYDEKFVDDSALIDARKDKRMNARRRRRIIRVNIIVLCFLLIIGGTVGTIWWINRVPPTPSLLTAIVTEDFGKLSEIAALDINLNIPIFDSERNDYVPPIVIAVRQGSNQMVHALASYGADVNVTFGSLQNTPLHSAAEFGSSVMVYDLIYLGADVNAVNRNGQTPLHRAVQAGRFDIAELLLNAGADANTQTSDGLTPIDLAVLRGNYAIIELLGSNLRNYND